MEAETVRSRPSSSSKRKPFSDTTNLVIPTSTILHKLSSSLSTTPPLPKPKPNPNPNSKPYNASANKPDTNSSKSDTSIGSSNYKENAPNPSSIPQPRLSTPPPVSITNPGDGSEVVFEPLVVSGRRQTSGKTKDMRTPVAMPFTFSPLQKMKDNVNTDTVPFSYSLLQKSKEKGKAAAVPFTRSSVEKTKDKGKAVAVPPSFPLQGKTKDNRKAVSVPINCSTLVNTRNKRKAIDVPFSCPPLPRTRKRKIRNEFNEAGDIGISKSCTVPHPKNKKKRCWLLPEQDVSKHALPQEFVEQQRAYFKEVDEFELPEEEISDSELDEEERKNKFQDLK